MRSPQNSVFWEAAILFFFASLIVYLPGARAKGGVAVLGTSFPGLCYIKMSSLPPPLLLRSASTLRCGEWENNASE